MGPRVKAVIVGWTVFRLQLLAAPLLLVLARSWRGWFEGLTGAAAGVFVTAGLVAGWAGWADGPAAARGPFLVALVSFGLVLGCGVVQVIGRRPPVYRRNGVASLYPAGPPPRVGWDDVEDDHLAVAVAVLTRLDPWMPADEARATRARFRALLGEVRTHPDYHGLARVTARLGFDLRAGRLDPHHCYTYRPEPADPAERFGLFVFLHGHGSNYLAVLHALRPLADRLRLALCLPTFGYGNWEAAGGVEAVARAMKAAGREAAVDPGRVYLAGISQGGAGVGRAGAALADAFAGLVFISPTMEPEVLESPEFVAGWRGRPVLVVQGGRDHNVKSATVDAAVDGLRTAGVAVTYHREGEAGHFLFFARLDEVHRLIGEWMKAADPTP